jgi:hypothetical protein
MPGALKGTAKSVKEAYSLIMDTSISVGDQQLLLFLKVPAEHVGHALQHDDVEVAGMKVATNWPAGSVRDMAQEIIGKESDKPEYMLSDNGSNLRKAAELMGLPHHRDVSHTLATYLKQIYEKDPEYMLFSEQIGRTKHLALTDVGYLMPCKQRRMARFMNLYPIIDWAEDMLDNFHLLAKKRNATIRLYRGTQDSSRNSARCLRCLRTSCRSSRTRDSPKAQPQDARHWHQGHCSRAKRELAG